MTDKLAWLDDELQALHDAGLYNNIRTLNSPQGAWLEVDGKRVLNFCSNNYLGLANHPKIVEAAKAAIDKYGVVRVTLSGGLLVNAKPACSTSSDGRQFAYDLSSPSGSGWHAKWPGMHFSSRWRQPVRLLDRQPADHLPRNC